MGCTCAPPARSAPKFGVVRWRKLLYAKNMRNGSEHELSTVMVQNKSARYPSLMFAPEYVYADAAAHQQPGILLRVD